MHNQSLFLSATGLNICWHAAWTGYPHFSGYHHSVAVMMFFITCTMCWHDHSQHHHQCSQDLHCQPHKQFELHLLWPCLLPASQKVRMLMISWGTGCSAKRGDTEIQLEMQNGQKVTKNTTQCLQLHLRRISQMYCIVSVWSHFSSIQVPSAAMVTQLSIGLPLGSPSLKFLYVAEGNKNIFHLFQHDPKEQFT